MNASAESTVRALAARYYTDGQIYAQTRDRLFFRTWQYACHASRIAKSGDYFAFSLMDQDLVLIRGRDATVRCFFNVCQHRGHTLLRNTGRTRLVVCPYHAWSYDLDGQLRAAPGTKNLPGFDRSGICLTEVQTDVFCGFVFVNLDAEAPGLSESFPGVEASVRALCPDIEQREFAHGHNVQEHCNWLVAVENYNECYHCKVVHPTFASGVIDPQSYNIVQLDDSRCLRHSAKAQSGASAWYDTSGSDYGSFFLWPAFSLQIYPSGLINTYHWRPLAVDQTQVHREWYSSDGSVDDKLQTVIDLDRDTTFAEDLQLVERVQRGLGSLGYRPSLLVVNPYQGIDSEHSVAKLHEWVREVLDE